MVQSHLLEMDAKKDAGPTWETVRYMVAAIQYGGRITDDLDQLLMDTYAAKFFHQARPALHVVYSIPFAPDQELKVCGYLGGQLRAAQH